MNVQFQKYKNGEGKILLRQQERQEESAKPQAYQPSRELLFASLFYDTPPMKGGGNAATGGSFLSSLVGDIPFVELLTTFAMKVASALPDSQLARIFKGELNELEI